MFEIIVIQNAGLPQSGKNIWKMKFFPGQGKVREFCGWSGKFRKDLESLGKAREFENKWLFFFQKIYFFCSRGERMFFEIAKPISLLIVGLFLKERICSHGEQILSCKSKPKFEMIQLAPLK